MAIAVKSIEGTRLALSMSTARGVGSRVARTLLLGVVPVVVISTLLIFLLTELVGNDPVTQRLGEFATEAERARLTEALGLNEPLVERYVSWLAHAITGDMGTSYVTDIPVWDEILRRFPVDLSIALVGIVLVILLGFAAGIIAAVARGGVVDRAITAISSIAVTVPEFWLAIMMVTVLSVGLRWLPSSGYVPLGDDPWQWFRHIIMPAVALSLSYAAMVARQLRTSLVQALSENYVVGARVRGLSPRRVLFVHALRNASGPAIATIALAIPQLFGGTVVLEVVFALPGLGQYAIEGAQRGDAPVIQGVLLVTILFVLACNFILDTLLRVLQPATRAGVAK